MKLRRSGLGAVLAFGILAWPLAVEAQSAAKVPRIGILFSTPTDPPSAARILEPFRQALRERHYVEGQNVAIEYRLGGGAISSMSWPPSSSSTR